MSHSLTVLKHSRRPHPGPWSGVLWRSFLLLPILLLSACASVAPVADQAAIPPPEVSLYQWDIISGGSEGNSFTGIGAVRLIRPTVVAASGNEVYIVDAGSDILYLYERAYDRLSILKDLKGGLR